MVGTKDTLGMIVNIELPALVESRYRVSVCDESNRDGMFTDKTFCDFLPLRRRRVAIGVD
jgi:hypothetical protein